MSEQCYFHEPLLNKLLMSAQLVAFDMNGLIIDDEHVQLRSVQSVLARFNVAIDEHYWITRCVGKRADAYFSTILEEGGIRPEEYSLSQLVEEKNERYHDLISHKVRSLIRPGVRDLVDFLARDCFRRLAIATSALADEIDVILGAGGLDLKHRFQYIVSGAEVEKSKPDPEIYLLLAGRSRTPPNQCLVFEDSGLGVSAAYGSGMSCIAVPNEFTRLNDFSGADFVVDNLTRGAEIIQRRSELKN